jgi:hypothetical protein
VAVRHSAERRNRFVRYCSGDSVLLPICNCLNITLSLITLITYKDMKILLIARRLEPLFTIIGEFATALTLIFSLIGALPSNPVSLGIQLFSAKLFTPPGYNVIPSTLEVIPEGAEFIRGIGGTALLTRSEVTFAVQSAYAEKGTYVLVDGQRSYLERGGHISVKGTGCFLWLYHIDKPKDRYSYQLKC